LTTLRVGALEFCVRGTHRDNLKFLATALRHPVATGAIAPSSAWLCRTMLEGVSMFDEDADAARRPSDAGIVVELGCGTGQLTRHIAARLPCRAHHRFLGIEANAEFVATLNERYPTLRIVTGDALHTDAYLRDAGLAGAPVAAVLSALPIASLDDDAQTRFIDMLGGLLSPGCVFRTVQTLPTYPLPSAASFRERMAERFGEHETLGPVLLNVPPAVVLSWTAPRG